MVFLRAFVLIALLWCLAGLLFLYLATRSYGKRKLFAPSSGNPRQGACYAFTLGMAPWAKESVLLNLFSFIAGLVFHGGIFAALLLLALYLLKAGLPNILLFILGITALAGTSAGIGLLIKRVLKKELRSLSGPDDYLANLLSVSFSGLAFWAVLSPVMLHAWLLAGALLFIYIPLGKIRHCLFFFTSRYHFGAFYGRRGTFPPGQARI